MCREASKGNVRKRVINVVDWRYNMSVRLRQEVKARESLYIYLEGNGCVPGPRNRTPGQKLGKITIRMLQDQ